jgi:hypothetical protein
MTPEQDDVKRFEWLALAPSAIGIITALVALGITYGSVHDQERRIAILETKSDVMQMTMTRIDANVTFLTDRAKEDRSDMLSRQMR